MSVTSSAVDKPDNLQAARLHNAPPDVIADHLKRRHFFWLDLEGPTDERVRNWRRTSVCTR